MNGRTRARVGVPPRRRGHDSSVGSGKVVWCPGTRLEEKAADTKSVEETETARGSPGQGIDYGAEKDDHSGKIITDGKDEGAVYDHLEGGRRRLWELGCAVHKDGHRGGFRALLIDFEKMLLHRRHQIERLAVADAFKRRARRVEDLRHSHGFQRGAQVGLGLDAEARQPNVAVSFAHGAGPACADDASQPRAKLWERHLLWRKHDAHAHSAFVRETDDLRAAPLGVTEISPLAHHGHELARPVLQREFFLLCLVDLEGLLP